MSTQAIDQAPSDSEMDPGGGRGSCELEQGVAVQGGSFQGAAPGEDGGPFGPAASLSKPMAQEVVDGGELSQANTARNRPV